MKWFRRLNVNHNRGYQLRICPRWKRWRSLVILEFVGQGIDLMGQDNLLWNLRYSYKKYLEHAK